MSKPTEVTAEDLVRRIEIEDLSYAVQHYYGRDIVCTDDPKLEELWKTAYDAIVALDEYTEPLKKW